MKTSFQQAITDSSYFALGAEVVTSRGIPSGAAGSFADLAKELLADERINYISITDNPGGNPMLPPDYLAAKLADNCQNLVIHLSCKDFNRAGLETQLWRYAADGFENVLALSGDLPTDGFPTLSSSVFDIDSVLLLEMITAMNNGLPVLNRKREPAPLPPTHFFAGCAVNPFKRNENELIPQYAKLLKKVRAGAKWVLPQLGYDMRKFKDIQVFLQEHGCAASLIGNVYVLTKAVAKMFNTGKLAGCVVADSLIQTLEKYTAGADKGKQFFKELAAKQIAVFKGLGFSAAHIGGVAKPESFFEIIDLANSYAENDWKTFYDEIQYSQPNEFFYSPHTASPFKRTKHVNLFYRFSRCVHALAFHKGHGLYSAFKRFYQFLEKKTSVRSCVEQSLHQIEYSGKNLMYGCTDCGDCGLPDTAYRCPMNRCSKNMRNGPCGGTNNGRCEADDKDCIWAIAYDRLKYFGEWDDFVNAPPICYNAALKGTSAWANLYLDRDHSAKDE
ncbi:MAG: methylenetetrahydrofolate reductase C-terminal domain-containing protein [Planctomycetaceae bacterium]|jgi:methylenetetrahydrofolate reductase (NADPH)|nr:methylenetetrahydrofolate reductase C-terminal domain-containing protein [Planctomycetaceae bacterium]